MNDEIGFHSSRALQELDLARHCADIRAARCHLRLAEEHLDRVRALSAGSTAVSNLPRPA